MLAMDFEFILKVAEKRLKAALGKAEAGKRLFTLTAAVLSATLVFEIVQKFVRQLETENYFFGCLK